MRLDEKGRALFPQVEDSEHFTACLERQCDWFSAIPDSVIRKVIPCLKKYHFAARENHAVAQAFGASMAGAKPCVLMQNSGLGLSLDALLGLFGLYQRGLLLVVSNRGELPWEEVQHQDWGKLTLPILQGLGWTIVDYQEEGLQGLERAAKLAFSEQKIVVVMLHRGNLDE